MVINLDTAISAPSRFIACFILLVHKYELNQFVIKVTLEK